MVKYFIQDMKWAFGYLPYALLAAGVLFVYFIIRNTSRMKKGKETQQVIPSVAFYTYLLIILCLTLFSREQGSTGKIDLELGSTLKINARNTAYVVENILLFIPYGLFLAWRFGTGKQGCRNLIIGVITTLGVEAIQLFTGRGIFQLDDILTNFMGYIIGLLLFKTFARSPKI